jgi:hypothetical protein
MRGAIWSCGVIDIALQQAENTTENEMRYSRLFDDAVLGIFGLL